jgi:aspartate aminotransferase
MPSISNKGEKMPASPIRKLAPFADKAKKEGKHVFHLNIGQPDILTPQLINDSIHNYNEKVLAYIKSEGNETYRTKLVDYYKTLNVEITASDIVVTTGGSEALLFGLMSCLDAGNEIIVPEPFYANYNAFAQAGDINIVPISSYIQDGFALPPMEDFENSITNNTKAILICNPNNPTGYLYTEKELEVLAEICRKHDLFLFVDEVYREFVYDNKKHTSILTLPDLSEHAIVIDSISKRYSACGARLGALVTKNKKVVETVVKFAQARLSPPTLSEIAAEAALNVPSSYFAEVVEEYTRRRNILVEELNKIEGVVCPNPGGAFYVMCSLPVENAEHFCQWMLEHFDHNGKTVMMAPGSGFYASKTLGLNEVRLAYVLNTDDLKQAVECIRFALEKYKKTEFSVAEISMQ